MDITVKGRAHPIAAPRSFAEREELVVAYGRAAKKDALLRRTIGAAVGLCAPTVADAAGASYAACGYDLLAFGGRVYDYLRESGVSMDDIAAASREGYRLALEGLSPREPEVKEREVFTGASAAPSTVGL